MASGKKYSEDTVQAAYEKAVRMYGHRESVTAIDVGYKYQDEKPTKEIAIRIHVRQKLPETDLEAAEQFTSDIDGVPTDVIQAVYETQAEPATSRHRRQRLEIIQPGISIGHKNITAGTFGAVVYDNLSGNACVLSNWHVLAGSGSASPGDSIVQPGAADGGRPPEDTAAFLERTILDRRGDAAIAGLNRTRRVRTDQFGTGVSILSARHPKIGEVLEKSGRTTGVTRGRVDGTGIYFINYPVGRVGIEGFKIVSVVPGNPDDEEVSMGGDSGAVWYDPDTAEGVGLHFAGERNPSPAANEHAIACFLPNVLQALDVSLSPTLVPDFCLIPAVDYEVDEPEDQPPLNLTIPDRPRRLDRPPPARPPRVDINRRGVLVHRNPPIRIGGMRAPGGGMVTVTFGGH